MKKQFVLTDEDMKQIVADSFSVDTDKVKLEWDIERDDHWNCKVVWTATVEVPMNDQR